MEILELEKCHCDSNFDDICLYCFIREENFEHFIRSGALPELNFEREISVEVTETLKTDADIYQENFWDFEINIDLGSINDSEDYFEVKDIDSSRMTILNLSTNDIQRESTADTTNSGNEVVKLNWNNDYRWTDENGQPGIDKQQTEQ